MHLSETHLPVQSTEASKQFYVDVVSVQFAYRDPGRDVVFLCKAGRQPVCRAAQTFTAENAKIAEG